jgi:GxxExxY protein
MPLIESDLAKRVLGCAIDVHRALGPGLLERAYADCLAYELATRGFRFARELPVPVVYGDLPIACGFRADFVVERELLLEIKSVDKIASVHHAQILTYLRLLGVKQGLLINFNSNLLMSGVKSFLL